MSNFHNVALGVEGRKLLEALCAEEKISLSDGLRAAAILGLGGTLADVEIANGTMAEGAERGFSPRVKPTGRAHADKWRASCRLPAPWNAKCSARGAFAAAVREGLLRWQGLR